MTKYARIENSVAQEVIIPPEGFNIQDCFHPDIVGKYVEVPDDVKVGSTLELGKWKAPLPQEVAKKVFEKVSPMTFQMLFSSQERITIKVLALKDPVVEDWWSIVNDPRLTEVDLNLKSIQDALDYITSIGVLVEGRKEEILSGIVK